MKTLVIVLLSATCILGARAAFGSEADLIPLASELDVATAEQLLESGQVTDAEAKELREFLALQPSLPSAPGHPVAPTGAPTVVPPPLRPGVPAIPPAGHCVIASGLCRQIDD